MIKAIFFDIDGTLLSFKTRKISNKTLLALHQAREKGVKLFIATGRHKLDIDHFDGFSFDGYVTLNGQYCFNREHLIYNNYIDKGDVASLVSLLKKETYTCMFLEENRIFPNRIGKDMIELRKTIKFNEYPVSDPETALGKEVYQIITFVSEEEEVSFMKYLPNCEITRWHPSFVDIIPKNGSKKIGIEKMLKFYNLHPEEIMAIGDGGNDISMLQLANIGVAMGNASDQVKSYADYITSSVDKEGVYNALTYFGVIEK